MTDRLFCEENMHALFWLVSSLVERPPGSCTR
jgi:hypothetical protein